MKRENRFGFPSFLIHRKDLVVVKRKSTASYESKKPSGQDAHLADKKLVVNDTARARRISQARFFVHVSNYFNNSSTTSATATEWSNIS